MHCFSFHRWVKVCSARFGQVRYSFGGTKKVVAGRVRQVVFLSRNDFMGAGLGGLNVGRFRQVVV